MPGDALAQAPPRRAPASRAPSRGCRRPPRAAPRSSRRPPAARTPRRGRRRTPDACGSRRGPASRRARARRAPRRRRRSAGRSRIRPTASIDRPVAEHEGVLEHARRLPSSAPRSGALRPAGVATCARSVISSRAKTSAHSCGGIGTRSVVLVGRGDRLGIARVDVPDDSHPGIGRQDTLEPRRHLVGAVGDDDHAGVDRVADPDAAAVVDADPGRAGGHVDERVQDRPVGDRVGAVAHRLRLAVRRGDRAGVEVVAPDHDRRRDATRANQLVDRQAGLRAIAVAEPADAGGQPLEGDPLGRQLEPALQQRRRPGRGLRSSSSITAMSAGSPDSAAQRNGPMPRQKSGRI